jgi:methylated-DNA-[protein]-cysteine S-methyltransferase
VIWTAIGSPVGPLLLTAEAGALTGVLFAEHRGRDVTAGVAAAGVQDGADPLLRAAVSQLVGYFARDREVFDLPLAPAGTAFQLRVWQALRQIPYGATASYGEIARRLGLPPHASRAVGAANGANPISIVVPCHRVVGADGSLTGYGGGIERKRLLLDLERGALF